MPQNGLRSIVAVEEDDHEEDFIPGPPSYSMAPNSGGASLGSSGAGQRGSILSRVLNISGKRAPATRIVDDLQLSSTDHKEYVAGSGILASRDDLNMAPEACKLFLLLAWQSCNCSF